jgi:ArsR family transcriptional regulator
MDDRLQAAECAERLKALADPERLKIIECLQDGPKNVGTIVELLGSPFANVSHHLRLLHRVGMIREERKGRFVVYSLDPEVFRPTGFGQPIHFLDFGCCRVELGPRPQG